MKLVTVWYLATWLQLLRELCEFYMTEQLGMLIEDIYRVDTFRREDTSLFNVYILHYYAVNCRSILCEYYYFNYNVRSAQYSLSFAH